MSTACSSQSEPNAVKAPLFLSAEPGQLHARAVTSRDADVAGASMVDEHLVDVSLNSSFGVALHRFEGCNYAVVQSSGRAVQKGVYRLLSDFGVGIGGHFKYPVPHTWNVSLQMAGAKAVQCCLADMGRGVVCESQSVLDLATGESAALAWNRETIPDCGRAEGPHTNDYLVAFGSRRRSLEAA